MISFVIKNQKKTLYFLSSITFTFQLKFDNMIQELINDQFSS